MLIAGPMFLGRRWNPLTQCYGVIPCEAIEVVRDWVALHYLEVGQGWSALQKCEDLKEKFEGKESQC